MTLLGLSSRLVLQRGETLPLVQDRVREEEDFVRQLQDLVGPLGRDPRQPLSFYWPPSPHPLLKQHLVVLDNLWMRRGRNSKGIRVVAKQQEHWGMFAS